MLASTAAETEPSLADPTRAERAQAPEVPKSILVIDPDPLVRELVASGLALSDRSFRPTTAADPDAGLERLAERDVDLIVTEVVFEDRRLDAAEVARLRERAPNAAILVLTESPELAFRLGLEYDALVAKPPDMDELLRRAGELVARSRESVVRGVSLPTFLQILSAEGRSGTLDVRAPGARGRISLLEGRIVHARTATSSGREALFEMLRWTASRQTLLADVGAEVTITEPLPSLLLEFAVRDDESRRG